MRFGDCRGLARVICLTAAAVSVACAHEPRPWHSAHQSGLVTANGIRLHYLEWPGAGDVVLLLTGFGNDAHIFDSFAPQLAGSLRVIALSRRGFGESERKPPHDTDTRVEDIRQFLDELKLQRVHLVGHSMAGDEITRFATLHPDRVGRVVYLDAAYDRHRMLDLILADPSVTPFMRKLGLELKGSPAAADIAVPDMPPLEVWEHHKALFRAMNTFRPDYSRLQAPALALFAVPTTHPGVDADTPEPRLATLNAWWQANGVPYIKENVAAFRQQVRTGTVVEMPHADHYLFLGSTQAEAVQLTRGFLTSSR